MAQFLDELGLSYKSNHHINQYNVDFLVEGKYVVECYGDYWHCNPSKFESETFHRGLKCKVRERWARDAERQIALESLGFSFIALWECDITNDPNLCKAKLLQLLEGISILGVD